MIPHRHSASFNKQHCVNSEEMFVCLFVFNFVYCGKVSLHEIYPLKLFEGPWVVAQSLLCLPSMQAVLCLIPSS